jgi:hypothetical protein
VVPAGIREAGGFEISFRQSVSELERLAKSDNILGAPWDPNAVARLNGEMRRGTVKPIVPMHGLASAYQQFSPALVESVLDNVRTRVLGLALDLERVIPSAGEPGQTGGDPLAINYIITNHIFGHGNSVAMGSPGTLQLGGIKPKDLPSLLAAVAALGFAPEDVAELGEAIRADEADENTPAGKPGSRVGRFLGKAALGTIKSAGQAGIQEGIKLLGEMVRAYYGVGG